jgi:hypothetical protein
MVVGFTQRCIISSILIITISLEPQIYSLDRVPDDETVRVLKGTRGYRLSDNGIPLDKERSLRVGEYTTGQSVFGRLLIKASASFVVDGHVNVQWNPNPNPENQI